MAGNHITSEMTSLAGISYTINIWDSSIGVALERPLEIAENLVIAYDGNETMVPISNIYYSTATIAFWIKDDDDENAFNQIIDGDENQFFLVVRKAGNIFWRGMIMVDQLRQERTSFPYKMQLKSGDGLSRLNDVAIRFTPDAPGNIIQLFNSLLRQTLIQNADFGESETFITTSCQIYEVDMASAFSSLIDPLRYSKLYAPTALYMETANDGVVTYSPFNVILENILKVFGLCIKQHNGHWNIYQFDAYNENSLKLNHYSLDIEFAANPATIVNGTATQTNYSYPLAIADSGQIYNGEFYSFAPAMRQSRMKVVNLENKQILAPSYFTNLKALTNLGDVVSGDFSTGVRIRLNLVADVSNASWPVNFLFEWQITIKCGSNYFTNQGGNQRWTNNASDYFSIQQIQSDPGVSPAFFTLGNTIGGSFFDIITNDIPSTDPLDIQIKIRVLSLGGVVVGTPTTNHITGSIGVDYFNYNSYQAPNDEIQYFHGTNTDSSFVLDLGETKIADDPGTTFFGKLEIHNGTAWQDSEQWKRFDVGAVGKSLVENLLEIYFNSQRKGLRILNATIINPSIQVVGTISVDSLKLFLQRGEFNAGVDEWSGSWIEIGTYQSGSGAGGQYFDNIGFDLPSINGSNSIVGKNYKMNVGVFTITRTDEHISGSMGTIDVIDPGVNVGNIGDEILIINPFNGESESVILEAAFENGATMMDIETHVFSKDFPIGSIVSVPMRAIVNRLFSLENP